MHNVVTVLTFDASIAEKLRDIEVALRALRPVLVVDIVSFSDDTVLLLRGVADSVDEFEKAVLEVIKVRFDIRTASVCTEDEDLSDELSTYDANEEAYPDSDSSD